MTQNATICVGTLGQGIWRSSDGGDTWLRVRHGLYSESAVRALAVHPSDARIMYCGADSGVYRSADVTVFPSRTDTFGLGMVEALASLLPGVSRERIEAMQEYQAMMGDIQDVEVLLAALDKYLRKGKISSAVGQRFRDELLRRRQWLIEIYLSQANRLREFWPLSQSASAKATGKKGNKKK